jgi:RNA polymerase sigma-70 factor (ECF subfamily)
MSKFRRECSVRTWAYKLARHSLHRFRRDPYRRRGRRLETEELSHLADRISSVAGQKSRDARFERARQILSDDDQTLLVLRLDRRLSWSEVATVLTDEGEPVAEAAVRKRYERIKGELKKLVAG